MTALIEIQGVSKTYLRSGTRALTGVDLAIPEGEIFGLLGPNGAGKTTLLAVLLGLVRKDQGTVRVAGRDMDRDLPAIRRLCGLAPQDVGFYPTLTVAENLQFYAAAGGLRGARLRERVLIAAHWAQIEGQAHQRAERLSGGLKRRLNLALALLHEPRALFLDEPTAGVDPQSRAFILEVIAGLRERGVTVIYTSHYMEEVQQICSRIAILDRGRVLAQGKLADLLAGGRRLQLTLSQAPAADVADALARACPGAECAGGLVVVETPDPLAVQAALAPVLAKAGLGVVGVTYGHRNLEDLFLQLTHHRLRE